MAQIRDLTILGIHPVEPTATDLEAAIEVQWGADLVGDELREAEGHVREHFEGLCLIEVQLEPPDAVLDWGTVIQSDPNQPESNWQVVYDEQLVESAEGRWAFFLHCVNFDRPLTTPVGPRDFPRPTPCPEHLAKFKYELP